MLDRKAIVSRHAPVLHRADTLNAFEVGNGDFAFTADVTGLQTFPNLYDDGMPLGTMAQWGWHTAAHPEQKTADDFRWTDLDVAGRKVPYVYLSKYRWFGHRDHGTFVDPANDALGVYLQHNPHRRHLGLIGLKLIDPSGNEATLDRLTDIEQRLELWEGVLYSGFAVDGERVAVTTCCHPTRDMVAVTVRSSLVASGRVGVRLRFSGATHEPSGRDDSCPEAHQTQIISQDDRSLHLRRQQDADAYEVLFTWDRPAVLRGINEHAFELHAKHGNALEFCCAFAPRADASVQRTAAQSIERSKDHWQSFWNSGAAVDFAGSSDPRAHELERRVVLSRYVTAIHSAGRMPPAETGLVCNSWSGKFHLEMHWWHAAHFPFWGRPSLLERSLDWYLSALPAARRIALRQGYDGVRWPKQTGPEAQETPSSIGGFLIWQQPHPILYAEYLYRSRPTRDTLERYADMVEQTAAFMASYARRDESRGEYVLGPVLIPAQECHEPTDTLNPTLELSQWATGLRIAQDWRERLGRDRNPQWDQVIAGLSPLPVKDGVYLAHERCPQTYEKFNVDHFSMLGPLGMLPGDKVDPETMRQTLHHVIKTWQWDQTWGWD
ncbi:MAG TPA: hypothetical protein VK324_17840, partial [Tepidisphaeraceae bacterium]|nr:hypothetical protein [Tepidisphaeraceae bacterium]